jgi:hypothetical protein
LRRELDLDREVDLEILDYEARALLLIIDPLAALAERAGSQIGPT